MPTIKFINEDKTVSVNAGIDVRATAKKEKIQLYDGVYKVLNCRGFGLCGSCVVQIVEGNTPQVVSPVMRCETKHLTREQINSGYRLACQCHIHGNVSVKTHVLNSVR